MAIIKDKNTMFELFEKGEFGNTVRPWSSVEKLFASGYNGHISIRSRGGRPKGPVIRNLPVEKAQETVISLVKAGFSENLLFFGEWIPDDILVMKCQLARSERFFELTYRPTALWRYFDQKSEYGDKYAHGLRAKVILFSAMDEETYEPIVELFDRYPDSVIEFNIYDRPVGTLSRNAIIVEVRNY